MHQLRDMESALLLPAGKHAPMSPDFEVVYCYIIQLSVLDDVLIR